MVECINERNIPLARYWMTIVTTGRLSWWVSERINWKQKKHNSVHSVHSVRTSIERRISIWIKLVLRSKRNCNRSRITQNHSKSEANGLSTIECELIVSCGERELKAKPTRNEILDCIAYNDCNKEWNQTNNLSLIFLSICHSLRTRLRYEYPVFKSVSNEKNFNYYNKLSIKRQIFYYSLFG